MDSTTSSPQEREQRFREIYDAAYVDLLLSYAGAFIPPMPRTWWAR